MSALMHGVILNKKVWAPLQVFEYLVHDLGGETIFPVSTAHQVKGGEELLEDESTDDDVATTAQITTKNNIKWRYPFERQSIPTDEPWPPPEEGWEYVLTRGGMAHQKGTQPKPGETAWKDGCKTQHGVGGAVVTPSFQQYRCPMGP